MGMASASANKIVGDAVTGIRTVASFNLEHKFLTAFENNNMQVASTQKRQSILAGVSVGAMFIVMMGGMGLVFLYSIYLFNECLISFSAIPAAAAARAIAIRRCQHHRHPSQRLMPAMFVLSWQSSR